MKLLNNLSLKNKIFVLCLGFVLLVSLVIALFTRWLLVSSLTVELKKRGTGIAQSIADNSRELILTKESAELTTLVFDARLGNRKSFVRYLVINDVEGNILAHTFLNSFPENIDAVVENPGRSGREIREIHIGKDSVFNVSVPVREGIYTIGSVHIGLEKRHIQKLIAKLRFLFFSFLSAVTVIFFIMSHLLAKHITKPVSSLIAYTDQIREGNYDITFRKEDLDNKVEGDDEFKKLIDSFIKMTSRIKESREELLASEAKYRSLFTSGPNPIFVVDRKNFRIIDASAKACEVYGYGKDELLDMSFLSFAGLENGKFQREYPENRSAVISSKVEMAKKNGGTVFVNIHASPAIYKDREALIVATTDITELVEKDAQLIQASKMANLEKMSAGIAHELNQPLNAIKMGSEYLEMVSKKNTSVTSSDISTVSGEISTQVTRASEIVNRLRHFSRKSDFSREIVNINNCITAVNKIVKRELFVQDIELVLDLDQTLPPVLAHNNRMEQVIFNLVTNARDAVNQRIEEQPARAERGKIKIASVNKGQWVAVIVADNGVGIGQEDTEKIFESFYTTKEMGEGLGLGLPIIHGIVRDYNGHITVESTPGEGTRFVVTLPSLDEE